eukprot:g11239.t1
MAPPVATEAKGPPPAPAAPAPEKRSSARRSSEVDNDSGFVPVLLPAYPRQDLDRIVHKQFSYAPDYVRAAQGRGCSRLRFFREEQQMPEVILFRDHHAWCPFCQKAWILLEELRIPYAVVKVTMYNYGEKEWWYEKYVHQNGTFPSLIVLNSVRARLETLEAMVDAARGREKSRSVDGAPEASRGDVRKSGSWLDVFRPPARTRAAWVTGEDYELVNDSTPVMARLVRLAQDLHQKNRIFTPHAKDLSKPCWDLRHERTRAICFELVEGKLLHYYYRWLSRQRCNWTGDNSAEIDAENKMLFRQTCWELEAVLKENDGKFGMLDCVLAPWLERICAQLYYYKGFDLRTDTEVPAVGRWFRMMESRDSYLMSKADFFTHSHAIPYRIRRCFFDEGTTASAKEVRRCWEAVESGSASVPDGCEDDNVGGAEGPAGGAEAMQLRREATDLDARLEGAHRILRFWDVLQGKAEKELKVPRKAFDDAMRLVLTRLLRGCFGGSGPAVTPPGIERASTAPPTETLNLEKDACLSILKVIFFFKDRVSIPRDMGFHAGKRVRRAMFELIEELCAANSIDSFATPFPIPRDNRFDVRPDKFVGSEHWKQVPAVLAGIV